MAASTPDKRPVRVTILSQSYTLLTAGDPREVEELARYLDELMLSIAAKSPNADSTRIAVLACMHLADRLRNLENDLNELKERVDRKSEEFAGLLEQALGGKSEALANVRGRRRGSGYVRSFMASLRRLPSADRGMAAAAGGGAHRGWRMAHRRRTVLAARRRE